MKLCSTRSRRWRRTSSVSKDVSLASLLLLRCIEKDDAVPLLPCSLPCRGHQVNTRGRKRKNLGFKSGVGRGYRVSVVYGGDLGGERRRSVIYVSLLVAYISSVTTRRVYREGGYRSAASVLATLQRAAKRGYKWVNYAMKCLLRRRYRSTETILFKSGSRSEFGLRIWMRR